MPNSNKTCFGALETGVSCPLLKESVYSMIIIIIAHITYGQCLKLRASPPAEV